MMRTTVIRTLIASVTLIALFSCGDESPFLNKKEANALMDSVNTSRDPFHYVGNFVAIINNDIYYFNKLDSVPRRITNTPNIVKTDIKLSFDHSRIAYINADHVPVIINASDGTEIATLDEYAYLTQMEWAKDRLTLVIAYNRQVYFYGEALDVIQPDNPYQEYDHLFSFSMNSVGDQAYIMMHYNDYKKLYLHSTSQGIDEAYQNFDEDFFDYVEFYDNEGNYLLCTKGPEDDIGFEKVIAVQGFSTQATYRFGGDIMTTPKFNAESEVLLYSRQEDGVYQIKAIYAGTKAYGSNGVSDPLVKILDGYESATRIYIDWVQ